jgi:Sulfatase-modifying factor enzyme 1
LQSLAPRAGAVKAWGAMARLQTVTLLVIGLAAVLHHPSAKAEPKGHAAAARCPPEMVKVSDFCIDRWEASMVDKKSGRELSPYYPPHPRLFARIREVWQLEKAGLGDAAAAAMPLPDLPAFELAGTFEPEAVSRPGVVPAGYLSYPLARRACENAGKRLCTEDEWLVACRGRKKTKFPYGASYLPGKCNVHRAIHPAAVLHGNASVGLTDPRLNLVLEDGRDPVLRPTGATTSCASTWDDGALYDMVGNLDEWVEDESGRFLGGFYARMTDKGCEAKISSHGASYYDYSLGTRCCSGPS